MSQFHKTRGSDDLHGLIRFVEAQAGIYERALAEIRNGRKRTHWMWFIFPQIDGLGFSATSKRYAIKSVAETNAYLHHPLLGPRLLECMEAVLHVERQSAANIFGATDGMKLRSCATLFASVSSPSSVFQRVLEKYYQGEPDNKTLQQLAVVTPRPPAVEDIGSE